MTKAELVKAIFKSGATSTQQDAGKALDAIFNILKGCLVAGDSITLPNFGTFKIVERAARKGRNPATGEEIDIAASKTVKFTPSRAFVNEVRETKLGEIPETPS